MRLSWGDGRRHSGTCLGGDGLVPDDEASGDFTAFKGCVGFVDVFEAPCAGEQFVESKFTALMELHDAREIDTRTHRAIERSFECFLSVKELVHVDPCACIGSANSGDNAGASFARRIECLFDGFWQADGLEGEVCAESSGQVFDGGHGVGAGGVHKMRCAEGACMGLFGWHRVDGNDFHGAHHPCALDDVEADPSAPEDGHRCARADLGCVCDCPESGDHSAADEGGMFERDVAFDADDGGFRHAAEGAEGGNAGVVADGGSAEGMKTSFSIRH